MPLKLTIYINFFDFSLSGKSSLFVLILDSLT